MASSCKPCKRPLLFVAAVCGRFHMKNKTLLRWTLQRLFKKKKNRSCCSVCVICEHVLVCLFMGLNWDVKNVFKASSNGERRGSRTHVVGKSAVSQRSAVYIQAHRLMIYGCVMVRLVGWMDDGWMACWVHQQFSSMEIQKIHKSPSLMYNLTALNTS